MEDLNKYILDNSIEENIKMIQEIFANDDTLILRRFENQYNGLKCCVFFVDGMVDTNIINENVLSPIINNKIIFDDIDYISYLESQIIISSSVNTSSTFVDIVNGIITGDTVLLVDGCTRVIIICTKGWKSRNIEEPQTERVLRGPKEGFTESLTINMSLIRRRIATKDLKFHYLWVGERTNTKVCVCYIEGLVKDEMINTVIDKISNINIDGILDVRYIEEFIDDNPFSIFETTNTTEKPDSVSGKLLEGRFAVLVDGSPSVMTGPTLFIESLMASDDYYLNYFYASIGRILRGIGFIVTISIPALYLSLVAYHHETIPRSLLISIYSSRVGVPFPSFLELIVLLTVFEVLREAGTRAPGSIVQAISIVGVLVLGTAAVDARLISAPMIIIVGISSITGLMLTNITSIVSILRIILLLLSSILGIYGYIFGMLTLLINMFSLRSFGVPFMGNLTSLKPQSLKDTIIRAPWWYMRYRPKFISKDSKRGSIGGKGDE